MTFTCPDCATERELGDDVVTGQLIGSVGCRTCGHPGSASSETDLIEGPAHGDVLVTTKPDGHYLSVVPHPHRLSFSTIQRAYDVARRWAVTHNVGIWSADGRTITRLPKDGRRLTGKIRLAFRSSSRSGRGS